MPILVMRKGTFRSLIHAATLVKLLLAAFERSVEETRSGFSQLIASPDGIRFKLLLLVMTDVIGRHRPMLTDEPSWDVEMSAFDPPKAERVSPYSLSTAKAFCYEEMCWLPDGQMPD